MLIISGILRDKTMVNKLMYNDDTIQNLIKSPKWLRHRIRKRYYKTLGTSVIKSPPVFFWSRWPLFNFCQIKYVTACPVVTTSMKSKKKRPVFTEIFMYKRTYKHSPLFKKQDAHLFEILYLCFYRLGKGLNESKNVM